MISTSMENQWKAMAGRIVLPLLLGAIALANVARRPHFQPIHMPDLLQLVAAGMFFAIALTAIFRRLRERHSA
jgi:hypothetical protein